MKRCFHVGSSSESTLSSFTAAGQALGLTQAAVSQRIAGLEHDLDVSLFHRRGGRVELTDAGHKLYAMAQRIFELHEEARAAVTGRREPARGELTLAASSVPGEHLLPGLLADFGRRHPHITVRASISDSHAVLAQIERGEAQVGLVGIREERPHLEFKSIACDRLVVVLPPTHPWRRKRRLLLEQVARQPLILREPGSGSRWCLEQALTHVGRSLRDLNVALELGSNEAIKEAVLQGMGVAILSTHVVQREVDAEQLHALPVADLPLRRDIFAVRDVRRALPPPASLFLSFLEASASTPSRGGEPS